MSSSTATIVWRRDGAVFTDNRYSRAHEWHFDGGVVVRASSSPQVVRVPLSDASAVDPEEAFVASLASCHMLWFLSLAAGAGWVVDEYRDEAEGVLERNAQGKLAMTLVTLRPVVAFSGPRPSVQEFRALHDRAHDECFIAASVTTQLQCEPSIA